MTQEGSGGICCPTSGAQSLVIDSRRAGTKNITRRRRQCEACRERFTTYEVIAGTPIEWRATGPE